MKAVEIKRIEIKVLGAEGKVEFYTLMALAPEDLNYFDEYMKRIMDTMRFELFGFLGLEDTRTGVLRRPE